MQSGRGGMRWVGVALLMFTLISLSPSSPVRAATIVVDTAGDGDVPANASHCPAVPANTCTLRDAVAKSVSGDTISIASGLGTIHVTHAGGTITIGHDLTIAGQGATTTTIDAEANTQPFAITGPNTLSTGIPITANVTFRDLTIQNISVTDGSPSGGGAVLVQSNGTLTLTNVNFLDNSNTNDGSGVFGGGAVFLESNLLPPLLTDPLLSAPLIITNCTFAGNQTDGGGAAIQWNGPITITNSTFTNNAANGFGGGADGGAILDGLTSGFERPNPPAAGIVTVSNSTFSGNSSMDGDGGAISANAVVATNVTFTNNQTINGFGGGAVEVHLYPSTGSPPPSKIVNSTFEGNIAGSAGSSGQGGAILVANGSLTLLNDTITNNSAGVSGGGVSFGSGSLMLGNTIVAGNTGGITGPDADAPITSLGHNLIGMIDGSSG